MKIALKNSLLLLLFVSIAPFSSLAQKKKASRIKVEHIQEFNKPEALLVSLVVKFDRYAPYENATVEVYQIGDTSKVLMGEIKTDRNGLARYLIEPSTKLLKDEDNLLNFEVVFPGTESIKMAKRSVTFKQARINMAFYKKEESKYVEVELSELDKDMKTLPAADIDIVFYVQGTFSLLPIGEKTTNKSGKAVLEFPNDLPGDRLGELMIVTKVVDDDNFGTIETKAEINWGVPLAPVVEKRRGLGDTDAPLWMVYTLIILLSAVWFHYMYVIYMIIRIKQSR